MATATLPASEYDALRDLYDSTDGANWYWRQPLAGEKWNFTGQHNPCTKRWQGLLCTLPAPHTVYYVQYIELPVYGLNGTLPASIGVFSHLQVLNLGNNFIHGPLPDSVANLTDLFFLSVEFNSITGRIPHVIGERLHKLQYLYLNDNYFTGSLPASLGKLSALELFVVRLNRLTGPIPPELGNLTELTNLQLFENELTGTIPLSLCNLTKLTDLALSANNFTGTIPPKLAQLSHLAALDLGVNLFTGPFPNSFATTTTLITLVLQQNQFSGTLPGVLNSSVNMTEFTAQDNYFSGTLPVALTRLSRLSTLYMSQNLLTGTLPAALSNCAGMVDFSVDFNSLTGTIPPEIGSWRNLTFLDLYQNYLTGSIPESVGNLNALSQLVLDDNYLTSTIPPGISSMIRLQTFYVQSNLLTGTLVSDFGSNQRRLQYLYGDHNLLTGSVPAALFEAPLLVLVLLTSNFLTGTIPATVSNLRNLNSLQLGDNQLSGSLSGLFNATAQRALATIQLDSNLLTGTLPEEIFALPQLVTFVAADNCLHGSLPTNVCGAAQLQSLVLDGLSSASACQRKLLRGATSSYTVTHIVSGSVASCLYAMPVLQTLHLSGNGFTGSLNVETGVSQYLSDLTVSHNLLTGRIPAQLLQRSWVNLDLSYNRLSGSIPADRTGSSPAAINTTTLSLENNRLSGEIPGSLRQTAEISVLESNVFSCRLDGSDLPVHDGDRKNYECGSDGFNIPYLLWLGLLVTVIAGAALAFTRTATVAELPKQWLENFLLVKGAAFQSLWRTVRSIAQVSAAIVALTIVVLVPVYVTLSHYEGTLLHQYAWALSAAFLSGSVVVGVEMAVWVIILVLLVCALRYATQSQATDINKIAGEDATEPETSSVRDRWRIAAYAALYISIDILVVGGANFAYVYVAIYKSSAQLVFAQVWMSFFKLLWNNVGTEALLRAIVAAANAARAVSETSLLKLRVAVTLMNNIVIPCVAAACVSPSCFYNVLVQAPSVTSSYNAPVCILLGLDECVTYKPLLLTVTYNPPFRYSYQCSSSLVTYYAPAFVILCIVSTFVSPTLGVLTLRLHNASAPTSHTRQLLGAVLPRMWLPPSSDPSDRGRYFNGSGLVVNMVNFLGLLLTFGVVFPPLGVAFLVAQCAAALWSRMTLGRFVGFADTAERREQYLALLDRDCSAIDAREVVRSALWMLVTLGSLFYMLFLFDTLGDTAGFRGSYWIFIVMPAVPLVLYSGMRLLSATAQRVPARGAAQVAKATEAQCSVSGGASEFELRVSSYGRSTLDSSPAFATVSAIHSSGDVQSKL
jgi:Leucine-rich repeat (LRR) protein